MPPLLYKRVGDVTLHLHLYPGEEHGFFNYRNGETPCYARTVADLDRFLADLGDRAGGADA